MSNLVKSYLKNGQKWQDHQSEIAKAIAISLLEIYAAPKAKRVMQGRHKTHHAKEVRQVLENFVKVDSHLEEGKKQDATDLLTALESNIDLTKINKDGTFASILHVLNVVTGNFSQAVSGLMDKDQAIKMLKRYSAPLIVRIFRGEWNHKHVAAVRKILKNVDANTKLEDIMSQLKAIVGFDPEAKEAKGALATIYKTVQQLSIVNQRFEMAEEVKVVEDKTDAEEQAFDITALLDDPNIQLTDDEETTEEQAFDISALLDDPNIQLTDDEETAEEQAFDISVLLDDPNIQLTDDEETAEEQADVLELEPVSKEQQIAEQKAHLVEILQAFINAEIANRNAIKLARDARRVELLNEDANQAFDAFMQGQLLAENTSILTGFLKSQPQFRGVKFDNLLPALSDLIRQIPTEALSKLNLDAAADLIMNPEKHMLIAEATLNRAVELTSSDANDVYLDHANAALDLAASQIDEINSARELEAQLDAAMDQEDRNAAFEADWQSQLAEISSMKFHKADILAARQLNGLANSLEASKKEYTLFKAAEESARALNDSVSQSEAFVEERKAQKAERPQTHKVGMFRISKTEAKAQLAQWKAEAAAERDAQQAPVNAKASARAASPSSADADPARAFANVDFFGRKKFKDTKVGGFLAERLPSVFGSK